MTETPAPLTETPIPPRKPNSTIVLAVVAVLVVLGAIALYAAYRAQNDKPVAYESPSPTASASPSPAPSASAIPSASPTASPSPSPSASPASTPPASATYTSTADKLTLTYPVAYRIVDTASEDGQLVQGAYISITNDPALSVIQTSTCSGPYMISQIHSSSSFSTYGSASSWPFIDSAKVSSLKVGGYDAYQVSGTYNSQGLGTTAGTPALITLINAPVPLQMITCLPAGKAVNTSEYSGILNSFTFK